MPQFLSTHLTSSFNFRKVQIWPRTFPLCNGDPGGGEVCWNYLWEVGAVNAQWEFARPVLKNLKLKLEVRWVLQNWGKTEAFRCFLRKWKSVKNWLRYKQFSDFPNSKIFAGMLKKLAAQLSHCATPSTRRDMRFSVFTNNI